MGLKLRVMTKFPALFNAAAGIIVERVGRVYTIMLDYLSVALVDSISDPTSRFLLVGSDDGDGGTFLERIALDDFQASVAGAVQVITDGGAQNINTTAATVEVNQTVGAAITLTLPLAAAKVGPVKVVDWKGDAGTNNITIALSGSDTFQGGLTSWTIGADNASAVFTPIPGSGYAV